MVTKSGPKEINLLLLGATGAGKSTFINGLANYFTHRGLEEALAGTHLNLIPFHFSAQDEEGQNHSIKIGIEDSNENLELGSSATRAPRSYIFQTPDVHLRCIDTAGIGDVQGKEKDKANFQKMIHQLAGMKKLSGICIFVGQSNARLTEYFTFCVNELFKHLDRDARKNIVFLFSKSRTDRYKSGDSHSLLKKLLQDPKYEGVSLNPDSTFFVDNEAVRLLAKRFNNISFSAEEKTDCVASWKQTTKEVVRMLDHVSALKTHIIYSTVLLNKVQNLACALIDPLVKIFENAEKNIDMHMRSKEKAKVKGHGDSSMADLLVPKIVVNGKKVKPRMVCAAQKCSNSTTSVVDGALVEIEKFDRICHDNCYILGLRFLNKLTPLNYFCEVMDEGVCTKCWCSWKVHKNITWDFEEVIVQEKKQVSVSQLNEHIRTLQDERDKILDVVVKLGIFLDQNAILPNSDDIAEQIKNSVKFEALVNREINVKYLQSLLEKYEKHKQELKASDLRISAMEATSLIDSLSTLATNGQIMEACVQFVQLTESENRENEIVRPCPLSIDQLRCL